MDLFERMQAEVQCLRCSKRQWVDYKIRHAGTRDAPVTNYAARCQDRACPRGEDFTIWTGHVRPKAGAWDGVEEIGQIPFGWI